MSAKKSRRQLSSMQDSMPGRYSFQIKLLSFAAFLYVILAFLNETICQWYPGGHAPAPFVLVCCEPDPGGSLPFWLSHWTEYVVILVFGTWRTVAEKNPYTRKRLAFLTASVGVVWWLIPAYMRIPESFSDRFTAGQATSFGPHEIRKEGTVAPSGSLLKDVTDNVRRRNGQSTFFSQRTAGEDVKAFLQNDAQVGRTI